MKNKQYSPVCIENSRLFGLYSGFDFLRLQDGTFIELGFGVRFDNGFPNDFEFALECSEFVQDHFEAIRKGQKSFRVGKRQILLTIVAPEISEANFDCGEISYYYNGLFNCKMTKLRFDSSREYQRFIDSEITDWIIENHELCTSQACNDTEAFVLKNDIPICDLETESNITFECEGCKHNLPVSYSIQSENFCFLCDPKISTEELLK